MSEVLFARQPIFDPDLKVMGFELFFRAPTEGMMADGNAATSQVVLKAFGALDTANVLGGKPAHVNVSDGFLRSGSVLTLPADQVVLDLTADLVADDEMVAIVEDLADRGYTIALEDCVEHPALQAFLPYARYAKVNVDGLGPEGVEAHVEPIRAAAASLVATRVETHETFEACKALGFGGFQGFFLCRPRPVVGHVATADRTTLMRLLAAVNAAEIDLIEVEELVAMDVGMSYRLLRIINSAYYQVPREITSIRQAIRIMGTRQLRQWLSLMALAGIDNKPPAVFHTALVRARMADRLATMAGEAAPETFFVTGLFSSLDALMDRPLADVVEQLPLAAEITEALLNGEGRLGEALGCVMAQERCSLADVRFDGLDEWEVQEAYLDAVTWATEVGGQVRGVPASA